MSTIATTVYNNIPKDSALLKKIKPLKKGERVQYRVFGSYDPSQPDKFFGRTLPLPVKDTITDPETGEVYDIAFIKGYKSAGEPDFGEIWFNDYEGSMITLNGGNATEMKMYQYMELCNYNGDNPDRDTSKPILIERISEEKDRMSKKSRFLMIADAMKTIETMNEQEVINFIRANRMPDTGSHSARVAYLEDVAQNQPEIFMNARIIEPKSLGGIVDQALEKKIINWNTVTREFSRHNKKKILTVKKPTANPKVELENFLFSPEGHETLDWIKEELEK